MNLESIAYANTLSINARFNAFENFFWAYLKNNENEENAKHFRKMFLELYCFHVQQQLDSLPHFVDSGIVAYLKNEQKVTKQEIVEL